jgi:hypothetical protein
LTDMNAGVCLGGGGGNSADSKQLYFTSSKAEGEAASKVAFKAALLHRLKLFFSTDSKQLYFTSCNSLRPHFKAALLYL